MREVKVLFYELEEHLEHPSLSIQLKHGKGFKIHYVRDKIDDMCFITGNITGCIINSLTNFGLYMPVDHFFRIILAAGKQPDPIILHNTPIILHNTYDCIVNAYSLGSFVPESFDNLCTPFVRNSYEEVYGVGGQLAVFGFRRKTPVYDIEVLVNMVGFGYVLDDFRNSIIFILMFFL